MIFIWTRVESWMGNGQGLFAKKVKDGEGKRQQAHKDSENKDAAPRT